MLRAALNGRRVAYTSEDFEAQSYKYATFGVRSIGRHHAFYRVYDSTKLRADVKALDLLLCAGGQVAFIVGYGGDSLSGAPWTYEVRVSKGRHSVLLDRGTATEPGTLRATPGRVIWTDAGSQRRAATTCARPSASVAVPRLTDDDVFGEPR